jgi:hypothetical protein
MSGISELSQAITRKSQNVLQGRSISHHTRQPSLRPTQTPLQVSALRVDSLELKSTYLKWLGLFSTKDQCLINGEKIIYSLNSSADDKLFRSVEYQLHHLPTAVWSGETAFNKFHSIHAGPIQYEGIDQDKSEMNKSCGPCWSLPKLPSEQLPTFEFGHFAPIFSPKILHDINEGWINIVREFNVELRFNSISKDRPYAAIDWFFYDHHHMYPHPWQSHGKPLIALTQMSKCVNESNWDSSSWHWKGEIDMKEILKNGKQHYGFEQVGIGCYFRIAGSNALQFNDLTVQAQN